MKCPKCGCEECYRDDVNIGVGVIYGPSINTAATIHRVQAWHELVAWLVMKSRKDHQMRRKFVITFNMKEKYYYTGPDNILTFVWSDDISEAKFYKTGSEALKDREEMCKYHISRDPAYKNTYDKYVDIECVNETPPAKKPKPVKTFHKVKYNRFTR